ncbi:uncharacterized protein N7458_012466 [Penicillium daleae]|uniref:Uncharacterized protein n=1 Tax=Penicillium daleae TaxID=63821 RepID=A0AAD6BVE4_9EURO|nr:uncharacterized protein N7458_012466 [Penicillium daleae]KAJ5433310.1 hypothetical protein N7458_012466 [Penicillium daleae]
MSLRPRNLHSLSFLSLQAWGPAPWSIGYSSIACDIFLDHGVQRSADFIMYRSSNALTSNITLS